MVGLMMDFLSDHGKEKRRAVSFEYKSGLSKKKQRERKKRNKTASASRRKNRG